MTHSILNSSSKFQNEYERVVKDLLNTARESIFFTLIPDFKTSSDKSGMSLYDLGLEFNFAP